MVGQTDFYERFASVTEWRAGSVASGCNRLTRRYVEIGKPRVCVCMCIGFRRDGEANSNGWRSREELDMDIANANQNVNQRWCGE